MPHLVVLGVDASAPPALEGGQQPDVGLGLSPLVAGLLNPLGENLAMLG